ARRHHMHPDARERARQTQEHRRRELTPIARATLDAEDTITVHMLEVAVDFGLASLRHQLYQLAVDQMQGPQVSLAMLLNYHTLETEKNARDLLERFARVPAYLAQHIANLREGMAERRTAPRIRCERVIGQLGAL